MDWDSLIKVTLPGGLINSNSTIGEIIWILIPYIYGIAGFLLLLYAVLAGYQILKSQGDPKALGAAREKITNAIIGFIIMFSSYWIVQLVAKILILQKITDIFGG